MYIYFKTYTVPLKVQVKAALCLFKYVFGSSYKYIHKKILAALGGVLVLKS